MFRFRERAVRRGFSFERNVRRGTADSAARSERGEARRQETEKPRIRGMQGFVELPGFEPGIILLIINVVLLYRNMMFPENECNSMKF